MAVQGNALLVRMLTAALALACVAAVMVSVVVTGYYKGLQGGGNAMVSVLVFPIALGFYGGPPLLAMAMASRSRSMAAALVALLLAVLIATWFVLLRVGPWDYMYWRNADDAQMRLLIGVLFGAWPVTGGAWVLWLVINRRGGIS